MDNKWENIKIAIIVFICVFGLVTCHGIDSYSTLRLEETKTELMEAARDRAKAQLALEKLRQRQGSN